MHQKEMLIDQSSPKLKVNFPAKVSTSDVKRCSLQEEEETSAAET